MFPSSIKLAALPLLLFFQGIRAQETPAEEKKSQPMIRIICVGTLEGKGDLVLASRDEEGGWKELAEVSLRPSFISEWLPAEKATLHLTIRAGDKLESVGSFKWTKSQKRMLVILIPDERSGKYRIDPISPESLSFSKGSTLAVNYSTLEAVVRLGKTVGKVASGNRVSMKAIPEENGMFRMLVGYTADSGEIVACYDRFIRSNPDSREFLLLFPDPGQEGFKVFSLAEFGPFE